MPDFETANPVGRPRYPMWLQRTGKQSDGQDYRQNMHGRRSPSDRKDPRRLSKEGISIPSGVELTLELVDFAVCIYAGSDFFCWALLCIQPYILKLHAGHLLAYLNTNKNHV